jgi:hypothetical protein
MNCKKCGFLMEEDARECPFCHFSVQDLSKESKVTLTNDATATTQSAPENANQFMRTSAYYPMKWYKFLVYFLLIASAVVNIITACAYFALSSLASQPILLVGAGIMSIAMGIFCLVVRSQLVKYKRSAPAKLTALYVWNIVFSVVYTIVGAFGIDMMGMTSTLLPTLFWNVILIIANKVYFKKRAELFCN